VRDVYLQRPANDVDIATSASPAKIKSIFAGDHMVDLPRSTVKLTHQGQVRGGGAQLERSCLRKKKKPV
jgi:tRNA nucleotidyltransferase/poly(A) polymerase